MTRDRPNIGVEALGRDVFFEGAGRFMVTRLGWVRRRFLVGGSEVACQAAFFLESDKVRERLDGAVVGGGFECSNGSDVARGRWWQTLQGRAALGLSSLSKIDTRSER